MCSSRPFPPDTRNLALETPARRCGGVLGVARRFKADRSGATAVEFAVVAPMFFFLMFVIAETALIFVAEQVMDNAVLETARLVRTGQVQKARMSGPAFKTAVCGKMSVFIRCNSANFYLDVASYGSFSAMQMSRPVNADGSFQSERAYDFGQQGDIVVVRAYYQWPTNKIFGGLSLKNLSNGKRLIGSFSAFRNEPFGPTS